MADRKLIVKIIGDESDLLRSFNRSTKATQRFSVGIGTIVKSAVVFSGVEAGLRGINSAVRAGVSEFSEYTKVQAQTQAVLKSTGRVANVSAKDVDRLASSISRISGLDDEAVASAENLLLTFKNVRNELGQGNRVFDRATQAAVDLSVAGFGSMESTAKQLGKALNDPIRGMTALSRAGVTFTQAQQDQIKALVGANKLLEAQKLILKEVESQVGGSAKALGKTLPGQLNRLRESLKNTAGDLVKRVAPAFANVLDETNRFIDKLGEARGVRAKINVAFEGIESIARNLFAELDESFRRIDWAELIDVVGDGLLAGVETLATTLNKIKWDRVGKTIGDGLAASLDRLATFVKNADFGKIGEAIVNGIVDFLKNVNWVAVITGVVRLMFAAVRAVAQLQFGIGKAIAGQIANGVVAGLRGLADVAGRALRGALSGLARIATEIVLKIIEPFTHLPAFLGSQFRKAKEALEKGLADMAKVKVPPITPKVAVQVDTVERNRSTLPSRVQRTTPAPRTLPSGGRDLPSERPIVINTTVKLDDKAVGQSSVKYTQKKKRSDPAQRRGPNR